MNESLNEPVGPSGYQRISGRIRMWRDRSLGEEKGSYLAVWIDECGARWWKTMSVFPERFHGRCAGRPIEGDYCWNKGKFEFEGAMFCGIHHPPAVWAKHQKRLAKERRRHVDWSHRSKLSNWESRRVSRIARAFEEIAKGELNDPASYAAMILKEIESEKPVHPGYDRGV